MTCFLAAFLWAMQDPEPVQTIPMPKVEGRIDHLAFDPKSGRGVVVLSDAFGSVADIAFHLLDEKIPLRTFPPRQ